MSNYEIEFNNAVQFTLVAEGVLTNNPNDRGGLTKYGITQGTWDDYRKLVGLGGPLPKSVSAITVQNAIDVYHLMFWQTPGIGALPRELQVPVFDFGVNSGLKEAAIELQKLLHVTPDGDIGPKTLAAAEALSPDPVRLRKLRNDYVTARGVYDMNLAQHNPKDVTFIEGWFKRVASLYDFAY